MSRLRFWDHVEDLRTALVRSGLVILIGTVLSFCFHKQILGALLAPLNIGILYLISPLEGFSAAAKIALWSGIIFSSPFWLYFLFSFLLPALKAKEKALLFPFLILSLVFTCIGIIFAYKVTIPFVIDFFNKFNVGLAENSWCLGETLDFIIGLILAHGITFELYVVFLFLIKFDLLTYNLLCKIRRGVIVAIFILAAILTPPDVVSQLLLAFPMLLLFESALLFARLKK